jgi:NAD-dependent dihydropyrimidine dehydrogenase PreA subunit
MENNEMAKDLSKQLWHGIPRTEIPWYPTINADKCIGCELCYVTCGREVFEFNDKKRKAEVARPFNCMVGCSTCAMVCPTEAISFPGRELIWKTEREHKIFQEVRREAKTKREKENVTQTRTEVEQKLARTTAQMRMQIAGEFGEKQFLVQLWNFLEGRPYDIVNLKLEIPTVIGSKEKAPSFMQFDVISTETEDVLGFLMELRALILKNGLVVVAEQKL